MVKTKLTVAAILGGMVAAAGCSATGAAMQTLRMGKNASEKDSHLNIYLDGKLAKQDKLKKAYFGHASFKVKEPVSTSPTFRFEFKDPEKFGRITGTSMQIHQEFEADYSHQAEFIVTPRGSDTDNLMRPNTDYSLGSAGSEFRVANFAGNETNGVTLKPGVEYLLVFTVSGDRSESVQVKFETR